MPTDEEMTLDERLKYLRKMKKRYDKADHAERAPLLDEMEHVTELHRKSLIRLLSGDLERHPRTAQRGVTYGAEVGHAVRVIAESLDYVCAERLTPNLAWMAAHLVKQGELIFSPELQTQLEQISVSSVRRMTQGMERDLPRRLPRGGPERANLVTRDVPMKRIPWNEATPGHFEVDLVHHGGATSSGDYVHTLQLMDVATAWSERVAVLGRSYVVMEDAFQRVLRRLPFPVLEFHPDNGSEFFNAHLVRFWKDTVPGMALSRSRPYRKNDNRFVEQKNSSLVRAYLGFDRLDTVAQTLALNVLYDHRWLYYNFFQPVMRLAEKTVITLPDQSTRIKSCYDQAQTPFDRLCATPVLSPQRRQELEALRDRTNPRQLRQTIYDAIEQLFALPKATPGKPENVYDTLSTRKKPEKGGRAG